MKKKKKKLPDPGCGRREDGCNKPSPGCGRRQKMRARCQKERYKNSEKTLTTCVFAESRKNVFFFFFFPFSTIRSTNNENISRRARRYNIIFLFSLSQLFFVLPAGCGILHHTHGNDDNVYIYYIYRYRDCTSRCNTCTKKKSIRARNYFPFSLKIDAQRNFYMPGTRF